MSRAADRARRITFRRVERDAATDDAIVRSIRRHGAELEPDPLFRRRLRGIVLNRHVAAREGYRVPPGRRSMTPIGRGVLLGTVLLALGATGAGAFSQSALPDDPLYPIKLQLESLRLAVAPAELRDDLLAVALEERARELSVAAHAGRWHAAEEAAWRVATAEAELVAINGLTPAVAARVRAHLAALDRVMAHAPPSAAAIVADRLDPARSALDGRGHGLRQGQGAPGQGNGGSPATGARGDGAADASPTARPSGAPGRSEASGAPSRTPRPSATPRPSHAPEESGSDASSP